MEVTFADKKKKKKKKKKKINLLLRWYDFSLWYAYSEHAFISMSECLTLCLQNNVSMSDEFMYKILNKFGIAILFLRCLTCLNENNHAVLSK